MNQEEALKILISVANLAQANGLFKTFEDASKVYSAIQAFTMPAEKKDDK